MKHNLIHNKKKLKNVFIYKEKLKKQKKDRKEYITEFKELIRLNNHENLNESIELKYDQIKKVYDKLDNLEKIKKEMNKEIDSNVIYTHDFKKDIFEPPRLSSSYNYKDRIVNNCKRCNYSEILIYINEL